MTEQKHLKALIRARMARTGESYTSARSHIVKPDARPSLTPTAAFRALASWPSPSPWRYHPKAVTPSPANVTGAEQQGMP